MRRAASATIAALLVGGLLTVPASAAQARKGADRIPPRLTVTSYAMENNTLTVAVSAADPSGVRGVSLLVRGKVLATDTTAPYQLTADLSAYSGGEVRWKVRAVDRRGNDRVSDDRKSRVKPRPDGNRPRPAPSASPSPTETVEP
ncbi:Flp pilus assembly protein TadG [Catenuloplanes nepalensis]|uniref:Flp pilus assembly protein TadG n=1 Tax=Catenuloplanes nepalensis TaxID=587533 RepID=A0ABT9MUE4_9ACTN|nr:Ig-like domain-containing protein [Catenuloplanes nepalensis]MDP9795040.1 Flp pilus assembly protein TadG [Catenuloplanes nepalensis]